MRANFFPGSYWTRERADVAVSGMAAELTTFQPLFEAIAQASEQGGDPAAAAAEMTPLQGAPLPPMPAVVEPDACVIRRGSPEDVPALAGLIVHGELPPLFIEPFVEGFCVVEQDGAIIGCGGIEPYGPECAVIRSVVTHAAARGLGLGGRIARLLIDDARAYGASDIYLFTLHAVEFWEHVGFRHLELSKWRPETHVNWQYEFCTRFPAAAQGVRSMWMPA